MTSLHVVACAASVSVGFSIIWPREKWERAKKWSEPTETLAKVRWLHMRRFTVVLSTVRNIEWAEKKIKIIPHVFYDNAEMYN